MRCRKGVDPGHRASETMVATSHLDLIFNLIFARQQRQPIVHVWSDTYANALQL